MLQNYETLNNLWKIINKEPLSVFGVSSHLFLRALGVTCCPGVSRPGVAAPDEACPGVWSHWRVLAPGVAPGVSAPLARPGVSSQRLCDGVFASTASQLDLACLCGVSSAGPTLDTSQRLRFAGGWLFTDPFTVFSVPSFAFDFICSTNAFCTTTPHKTTN